MNGYKRESEVVDDAPPLDSGLAKVDQKCEVESGSLQVVDGLGQVFVGQMLDTLDLDQQAAIHDQVRRVRAEVLALVSDRKGRLGGRGYTP